MRSLALVVALFAGCAQPPPVEVARFEGRFSPVSIRGQVDRMVLGSRPASEFQLFLLLNGEPVKMGVLTSTGTSVTNATTAVTFTIAQSDCPAQVFLFKCDTSQANVGSGATCDTAITGANHHYQIANAWDPWYLIRGSAGEAATICLDAPASTTINCAVFCMK